MRYSLFCVDELCGRFRVLDPVAGFVPHYNIAPGSTNPVIVKNGRIGAVPMQWGLVPHWVRDIKTAARPANARAEGLTGKPIFAELLRTRRCLVPASGFFEWKQEGGHKVPFYFQVKEEPVFAFAGLFDVWRNPSGAMLLTYTIITTAPNVLMTTIHDRMPAILMPDDEIRWVSREPIPAGDLFRMLTPYPPEEMVVHPVSERMNNAAVDDPLVIEPVRTL
jgi:putative SOS response-associated peptidase YedK